MYKLIVYWYYNIYAHSEKRSVEYVDKDKTARRLSQPAIMIVQSNYPMKTRQLMDLLSLVKTNEHNQKMFCRQRHWDKWVVSLISLEMDDDALACNQLVAQITSTLVWRFLMKDDKGASALMRLLIAVNLRIRTIIKKFRNESVSGEATATVILPSALAKRLNKNHKSRHRTKDERKSEIIYASEGGTDTENNGKSSKHDSGYDSGDSRPKSRPQSARRDKPGKTSRKLHFRPAKQKTPEQKPATHHTKLPNSIPGLKYSISHRQEALGINDSTQALSMKVKMQCRMLHEFLVQVVILLLNRFLMSQLQTGTSHDNSHGHGHHHQSSRQKFRRKHKTSTTSEHDTSQDHDGDGQSELADSSANLKPKIQKNLTESLDIAEWILFNHRFSMLCIPRIHLKQEAKE